MALSPARRVSIERKLILMSQSALKQGWVGPGKVASTYQASIQNKEAVLSDMPSVKNSMSTKHRSKVSVSGQKLATDGTTVNLFG